MNQAETNLRQKNSTQNIRLNGEQSIEAKRIRTKFHLI